MTDPLKTLLRNIQSLREQRGWSQEELSERCQYSRTYLGKIERGEVNPSFETLRRLSEVFEASLAELVSDGTPDIDETELYHEIFEHTSIPAVILNTTGHIQDFNRAFERLFERTDDQILERPIWELSQWLDNEVAEEKIRNLLDKARSQEHILETFTPEDSSRPMQLILNQLTLEESTVLLFELHTEKHFEGSGPESYELSEIRTKR